MHSILRAFVTILVTVLPVVKLAAVEFRALSWQEALVGVTYSGQPRGEELHITSNAFTAWQNFNPGGAPLEFRRRVKNVSPNTAGSVAAAPTHEVVARVVWPEGLTRGLLLFVPAPAGAPTRYAVVVIPERAADARPAALRIFNYSGVLVATQIGTQAPRQLEPRSSFDSDVRPAGVTSMLRLAEQGEEGWRVVVSRNIALPPDRTAYLFLRNSVINPLEPNNPKVDYKLIYDRSTAPIASVSGTAP